MSRRKVPSVREVALVAAAFLLGVPPALAGDRVRAPKATPRAQPAPAPVARPLPPSVAISFVAAPAQPAREPVHVDLRGPDGQVRRFAVEGGEAAIQYRQVVLRPGQSVVIRWVAAK